MTILLRRVLLHSALTAALYAQQSGGIVIDKQEWRADPVRHLYIHGVMNGDTAFQVMLPDVSLWKGRLIQFLEGGLGGNENNGSGLGAHRFALAHGAVYLESNQGHVGPAFFEEDDTPAELAYQASYAVLQYAKSRCVEIYRRAPRHVYVLGASGGGMRSIQLMERFPEEYHGAAPLVAPSDFQLGAFLFSLFDAYREPITPHRALIDDAIRVGGREDVLSVLEDPVSQTALERFLHAGFPKASLWLVDQSPVALLVMDYLKYRALPRYFDEFWTEPGYGGKEGEFASGVVEGLKGKVTQVLAPRRIAVELPAHAARLYGFTLRFTSGALRGEWRHVQAQAGRELLLSMVGPGAAKLAPGDEFELDNRDLIAWRALHRHLVLPGEPMMRDFLDAAGRPRYRQVPADQLAVLREPERTIGQIRGMMILVYGVDDPLIWSSLALHYERMIRRALGARAPAHYRIHFLENAVHGLVFPGAESRQVLNVVAMFRALEEVMLWNENGTQPQPGTRYTADANAQITLPPVAAKRGGYQPVVNVRARGAARRIEMHAGEEIAFSVEASDPDNDLALIEVDWEGDGKYEEKRTVTGRNASLEFRHRYEKPGTYFPTARATDATAVPGIPFRGIPNLQSLRVIVTGKDQTQ